MGLELWLAVGRDVCLIFAAVGFTLIVKAPHMGDFSSFVFLAVASGVQMVWSAIRFWYQIACLRFGRAQPSKIALTVLTVVELVLTTTTMAAGCSALGVAIFLDLDLRDCRNFSPSACPTYVTASSLVTVAGELGFLITLGMQWVLSFHYHFNAISA